MKRILVSSSRYHNDPAAIGAGLDEAAGGDQDVTLVHGKCDPRTTNASYIAKHGTDRVPWNEALRHPEYGPFTGGDWHAHQYALGRGWTIEAHPADWKVYKNAAGPIRNQAMVNRGADVLVAAPHPDPAVPSPGTRDCMSRARKAGIPVIDITAAPEAEGLW